MKLNALLDVDMLALQQQDQVTCLLRVEAPIPPATDDRPGETVIVVVDRSGSMGGEPLDAVRSSLHALADRIRPQDTFGVVVFDSSAEIVVPARRMSGHHLPTVHQLVEAIEAGDSTDLCAGYLLGLSEARRCLGDTGATVLLLSDGHANAGVTDPKQVGALASSARAEQITSTTIGIGAGYDEVLLSEIATQGNGAHRFAFTPDDAAAVVSEEAGDLLSKAAVNAFVRVRATDPALVPGIGTLHGVPRWTELDADGAEVVVIPLGDLYAGEQRELLVHFDVPGIEALGLHTLATFTIDYVALPDLTAQQVVWPMSVNVVPGDEAAGRVPNPTVTTARLLAETTQAKRQAGEALMTGDSATAERLMREQDDRLRVAESCIDASAPGADDLRARLVEERLQVDKLARGARRQSAPLMAKSFMEDVAMESRGRNDHARRQRSRNKRDF